jgi:hypothetical protein
MLIWESMPQSTAYQHEEGRGLTASTLLFALIHRSAWNRYSANFAFTAFYEVRVQRPTTCLVRSLLCKCLA